uniref:Uncharacterized protein n=1 Tax=Arundo donax TaxID=35708 RepID=A0A0A9C1Q9_ARUDO
MPYIIALFLS